jgi:hypothetical protein
MFIFLVYIPPKNDLIFHLDSDIFLGGLSQAWVTEAAELFNSHPEYLIISPLPGSPHRDDVLIDQSIINKIAPYTYQLNGMSTRLFVIDRSKFKNHKLTTAIPNLRNQIKAIVEGNNNAQLQELILSAFMKKHHLKRLDFLGGGAGLWSLHPPYRTKFFYDNLPALIKRIESNDLPLSQQGFYDIVDEVCNWTEAREKLKESRWWKRLLNN